MLLWFIAKGHSNLYYSCPECGLATTRPCAQGEFVPSAAVLSLIVVIKYQRLLKSSR